MTKNTSVPVTSSPGSRPINNAKRERYARYRAQALPRIEAYRKAGGGAIKDNVAYIAAMQWEKSQLVRERIEYLTKQAEERIAEKRARIEERVWAIHQANIKDFFETYETAKTNKNGNLEPDEKGQICTERKERPRLISDLPDDIAELVEDVTIDSKGRAIPKLYSKLQASKELRAMLNIGKPADASDVSRLSDAELIQQLSDQAKQLGVEINLNYDFARPQEPEPDASK